MLSMLACAGALCLGSCVSPDLEPPGGGGPSLPATTGGVPRTSEEVADAENAPGAATTPAMDAATKPGADVPTSPTAGTAGAAAPTAPATAGSNAANTTATTPPPSGAAGAGAGQQPDPDADAGVEAP